MLERPAVVRGCQVANASPADLAHVDLRKTCRASEHTQVVHSRPHLVALVDDVEVVDAAGDRVLSIDDLDAVRADRRGGDPPTPPPAPGCRPPPWASAGGPAARPATAAPH